MQNSTYLNPRCEHSAESAGGHVRHQAPKISRSQSTREDTRETRGNRGALRKKRPRSEESETETLFVGNQEVAKTILLHCFSANFNPKWSGKAPNEVIMGGNYSQSSYDDFWADSGTNFFVQHKLSKL